MHHLQKLSRIFPAKIGSNIPTDLILYIMSFMLLDPKTLRSYCTISKDVKKGIDSVYLRRLHDLVAQLGSLFGYTPELPFWHGFAEKLFISGTITPSSNFYFYILKNHLDDCLLQPRSAKQFDAALMETLYLKQNPELSVVLIDGQSPNYQILFMANTYTKMILKHLGDYKVHTWLMRMMNSEILPPAERFNYFSEFLNTQTPLYWWPVLSQLFLEFALSMNSMWRLNPQDAELKSKLLVRSFTMIFGYIMTAVMHMAFFPFLLIYHLCTHSFEVSVLTVILITLTASLMPCMVFDLHWRFIVMLVRLVHAWEN